MGKLNTLIEWLKGKKTFIVIAAGLAVMNLEAIGILPDGSYKEIRPTLELLGAATVTAKLNRMIQSLYKLSSP